MLIPIYKNKGDAQRCGSYRGIKQISLTMKIWERIIEATLKNRVEINKQQCGFMPGKETTNAMFALRILMEKYKEGQRELCGPRENLRQGSKRRVMNFFLN